MCGLAESSALILAAIIAFIGVTITASMSYCSNYRINNKKIEYEEKKLKRAFLKESFEGLRKASQELHRKHTEYTNETSPEIALVFLVWEAVDISVSVQIFLPREKRIIIEEDRKKTINVISSHEHSNEEKNKQGVEFRKKLDNIIYEELSLLSDKLRAFDV